ncbi:conjugal transfer protein TrbJ, partial [Escherichia coli]
IVVSLCLTFSVSVVFFVGAIVGWISVSEIYYSRRTGRKYQDIPVETPYAPGEHIKGGQQ